MAIVLCFESFDAANSCIHSLSSSKATFELNREQLDFSLYSVHISHYINFKSRNIVVMSDPDVSKVDSKHQQDEEAEAVKLKGDAIGDTIFSETSVLKTLIRLTEVRNLIAN